MAILGSKWMIGLLILVGAFSFLLLIGKKAATAELTIKASREEVWVVLTSIEKVKEWNKVLIPIEGTFAEGSRIKYEFYQEENSKAAVMDAEVVQLVTSELINQKGGIPAILTFNHRYILTKNDDQTIVKIKEEYRGVMVPFWNPDPVEKAYERLLVQLKKRVENE